MTAADLIEMLRLDVRSWNALNNPALLLQFVLRNGEGFVGAARPKGLRLRQQKQCFMNAARLSTEVPGLTYYEGYIASDRLPIPILHAWCVDDETRTVVDVTLREPEDNAYIGVGFAREELARELLQFECYGLLDTGLTANVPLIERRDPELMRLVRTMIEEKQA
jgi:hypothetical protein